MKKLMASLMALALALSLTACGGETTPASSEAASTPSTPSSQAPVSSTVSVESIAPPSVEPEEPSLNLALKGTAIADGVRDDNEAMYSKSYMNDANTLTLWQATDKGPENEENESWFGISWEEAQTFDTLFVLWEQAHPTEDGFRIEISDDGETWTEVEFTAVRGGNPSDTLTGGLEPDKQTDDIVLNEVVTTKNIRIVCFTHYTMPDNHPEYPSNTKSPTGVYEFEIYYSVDVEAAEGEGTESAEAAESTDDTVAE